MKATVLLLALLASNAQAAGWSSWWLTPDQQGQRALKDGDPSRAARLFTDPQRRAYAQIEARQYADAARSLAPLNDAESHYNRGNALARAGDLPSALSAYDSALKGAAADSPLHRDAQHNRDLVAKQLKSQEKQQQQGGGGQGGKSGEQNQKADQQNQAGGQQNQGQQNQGQQNQGQQNQGQQNQGQQNQAAGQQDQAAGQQSAKNDSSKGGDSSQSSPNNARSSDAQGKPAAPAAQGGASDSADQARRDVQSALNRSPTPNPPGSDPRASNLQNAPELDARRAPPPSEQTLSTDQWLRQIPDDPAGLLRRKFLIEHMMKQGTQP